MDKFEVLQFLRFKYSDVLLLRKNINKKKIKKQISVKKGTSAVLAWGVKHRCLNVKNYLRMIKK